jgi:hypothetical protein
LQVVDQKLRGRIADPAAAFDDGSPGNSSLARPHFGFTDPDIAADFR